MGSSGSYSNTLIIDFSLKSNEKNSEEDIKKFIDKHKKHLFQKKEIENDNDVIEEYIKNGDIVYLDLLIEEIDEDDDVYFDDDEIYLNSKDNTLEEIFEKLEEWDENEYQYSIYINKSISIDKLDYINLSIIEKYKIYNINFNSLRAKLVISENSYSIYGGKTITEKTSIDVSKYLDILSLPNTKIELISESNAY